MCGRATADTREPVRPRLARRHGPDAHEPRPPATGAVAGGPRQRPDEPAHRRGAGERHGVDRARRAARRERRPGAGWRGPSGTRRPASGSSPSPQRVLEPRRRDVGAQAQHPPRAARERARERLGLVHARHRGRARRPAHVRERLGGPLAPTAATFARSASASMRLARTSTVAAARERDPVRTRRPRGPASAPSSAADRAGRIRIAGATIVVAPRASSSATSSPACSAGRVTRTVRPSSGRHHGPVSRLGEDRRGAGGQERPATSSGHGRRASAPPPRGPATISVPSGRITPRIERDRPRTARERPERQRRSRRRAAATSRVRPRTPGAMPDGQAALPISRVAVVRSRPAPPGRPGRARAPSRPRRTASRAAAAIPRRSSPAAASTSASTSPSPASAAACRRSRGARPRASGRSRSSCARRRMLDVADRPVAPAGSAVPRVTSTSRGSARSGTATTDDALGVDRREVLRRVHRQVDPAVQERRDDLVDEQPLRPTPTPASRRSAAAPRSPDVTIGTSSTSTRATRQRPSATSGPGRARASTAASRERERHGSRVVEGRRPGYSSPNRSASARA